MRLYSFLLSVLTLAACKKEVESSTPTPTPAVDSCTCRNILLDRYKFVNWDGSKDTVDFISYTIDDSFKKPKGGFYGNPIDSNGYIEGVLLTPGSGVQYKIRFKNHAKFYYVKDFKTNVDKAACALLNDTIGCFSSYSITVNDSVINIPKRIIDHHGLEADTLFFY